MNRITLNLATRPFRNNTLVGTVLAVVFVATLAATAFNAYAYLNFGGHYQDLRNEETEHRRKLQGLDAEERRLSKEIVARDYRRLLSRGQYADGLITRRAFSWTLLFNKLEDVVPAEVMMTAIRPEFGAKGIIIRVDGIAKNHGALISLEDSLLKSPVFGSVYPVYERRVNPSRPEISFALNFDYIPVKASGGTETVPANPVAAAGPAPKGGAESAQGANSPVASAAPAIGKDRTAAAPAPAGKEAPRINTADIGTVGRDGRPRTPELLARVMAAPGGIYAPKPPAPPEIPKGTGKKSKGKGHAGTTPSTSAATTGSGAPGHPKAAVGPAAREGAPRSAAGAAPVAQPATVPAGLGEGAPAGAAPAPPLLLPPRRDPNLGSRNAGRRPPKTAQAARVEPVPATRLDVPLKFVGRPVGDVYAALSQAHGVRFVIDPAVDGRARITADLAGKNLKDALALLSKQAGHRVQRVEDGVYRVMPSAGGEPISDRPVTEEPLPGEGRP